MKGKSMLQLRKIKPFEEDFDPKIFAGTALDIYKEAFDLLQEWVYAENQTIIS